MTDFTGWLERTPASELNGWLEFERTEEIGWRPDWGPLMTLAALVLNRLRFSLDVPAVSPADLMPGAAVRATADTPEERMAKVAAGGGVVRAPRPLITDDEE